MRTCRCQSYAKATRARSMTFVSPFWLPSRHIISSLSMRECFTFSTLFLSLSLCSLYYINERASTQVSRKTILSAGSACQLMDASQPVSERVTGLVFLSFILHAILVGVQIENENVARTTTTTDALSVGGREREDRSRADQRV